MTIRKRGKKMRSLKKGKKIYSLKKGKKIYSLKKGKGPKIATKVREEGIINYHEKVSNFMNKMYGYSHKLKQVKTTSVVTLYYLYLFSKYRMGCSTISRESNDVGIYINLNLEEDDDVEEEGINIMAENVKFIASCIISGSQPLIAIPIFFKTSGSIGHVNILIYRRAENIFEHFEPHGKFFSGRERLRIIEKLDILFYHFIGDLNRELREVVKDRPLIRMVDSNDICPMLNGVQSLEESSKLKKMSIEPLGYCMLWCMFFTELCLINPLISSNAIYTSIMSKTLLQDENGSDQGDYLRNIIRGYSNHINNKIVKHFSPIFGTHLTTAKIDKIVKGRDIREMIDFLTKKKLLINYERGEGEFQEGEQFQEGELKQGDFQPSQEGVRYQRFKSLVNSKSSSSDVSDFNSDM
jgi:hypothetical protein